MGSYFTSAIAQDGLTRRWAQLSSCEVVTLAFCLVFCKGRVSCVSIGWVAWRSLRETCSRLYMEIGKIDLPDYLIISFS